MATTRKAAPRAKPSAKEAPGKAKSAVQGEGDYVSARKYNERTRAFVKRMGDGSAPATKGAEPPAAELKAAEKKALARSRGRQGDRTDARVMRANVAAARKGDGTSRR